MEKSEKKLFQPGIYAATITEIKDNLISEKKKTEYFSVRFEDDHNYIITRFYVTQKSIPKIMLLFFLSELEALPFSYLNTDDLIGKILYLKIEMLTDPQTLKTHLEVTKFYNFNAYQNKLDDEHQSQLEVENHLLDTHYDEDDYKEEKEYRDGVHFTHPRFDSIRDAGGDYYDTLE
jgi:hypothetical protein